MLQDSVLYVLIMEKEKKLVSRDTSNLLQLNDPKYKSSNAILRSHF